MLFTNQKIFLDVKDHSRVDRLEANIRQFGGIIEKFLSKEITCVVTNRIRAESSLPHKDATTPTSTQSQSLRPACGSRVLSRGQSLLMRSNSLKDNGTSVCDPVAFAQMWGIKIVTLDTIVQAIDRQLLTRNPSSPVSEQSTKSHDATKRRKFLGTAVQVEGKETNPRPTLIKFSDAFIKFEDTESSFRPFYKQYKTFPQLDLEGDLSNGIFKCGVSSRSVVTQKNVSATVSAKKQKTWSKRGYCECCDVMYDELSQHLFSADHQRFAECAENFADLDSLIGQISSCSSRGMLLPAGDECTNQFASGTAFVDCVEEVQSLNCNNVSAVAVEHPCHSVHLRHSQSCDHHSKLEVSDKVLVENCDKIHNVSDEDTERYGSVSISDMDTHTVKLETHCIDDGVDEVSDTLHSRTVPPQCGHDVGSIPTASDAVSKSVEPCNEAFCKEKLCTMSADGNLSHIDDMPELISSDCVVNLLEILSSENSVNSAFCTEKVSCRTMEMCENHCFVPPVNSVELPYVPTSCSYDSACDAEVLSCEKQHHQQTAAAANVTDECRPLLMSVQRDLSDRCGTAVTIERRGTNVDKSMANTEPVSKSAMSPAVDLPNLQTLSSPSVTSPVTDNDRTHNDASSCSMKADCNSTVLRQFEVHSDLLRAVPLSVEQPAMWDSVATTESVVPVYASCEVNGICTVGDQIFGAVCPSEVIADSFVVHDRLLTVACGLETAEQSNQPNCTTMQASSPCSVNHCDVSTYNDNSLCLPMAFSHMSCFSEGPAVDANRGDTVVCTAGHTPRDLPENHATVATDNCHSVESESLRQSSPLSDIVSLVGSACVSDGLHCSFPRIELQRTSDVNIVSDREVDSRLTQEEADVNNSYPCTTFETDIKSGVTAGSSLLHGSEGCHKSMSTDTAQFQTSLVDDGSCCIKSPACVSGLQESTCPTVSRLPEASSKSSVLGRESCDNRERLEEEADMDNDSASTLIYSCDVTASSLLEHANDRYSPDKDQSDSTVDCRKSSVSNADSIWKVISFDDCRMTLVRSDADIPALSAQMKNEVSNVCSKSSVSEHESCETTKPVDETVTDSDGTSVYNCDCPTSSVLKHASDITERTSETVDCGEPSLSTWKVISFVDCRMRLVRSKAVFQAPSTLVMF